MQGWTSGLPEINENYSRFQDGGWHSARPGSPTRWEIRLKLRIRTESITDWLKRTSHNLQHNCSKREKHPHLQRRFPSSRNTCRFYTQPPPPDLLTGHLLTERVWFRNIPFHHKSKCGENALNEGEMPSKRWGKGHNKQTHKQKSQHVSLPEWVWVATRSSFCLYLLVYVISQHMFDSTHPWELQQHTWQIARRREAATGLSADDQRYQREKQREHGVVDLTVVGHLSFTVKDRVWSGTTPFLSLFKNSLV